MNECMSYKYCDGTYVKIHTSKLLDSILFSIMNILNNSLQFNENEIQSLIDTLIWHSYIWFVLSDNVNKWLSIHADNDFL